MRPLTAAEAKVVDRALLVLLMGSGVFHTSPRVFYEMFAKTLMYALAAHLCSALVCQFIFKSCGTLIQQGKKAQKEDVNREMVDTILGFGLVVASIAAWPLANAQLGMETAIRPTLDECLPIPGVENLPRSLKIVSYYVKASISK